MNGDSDKKKESNAVAYAEAGNCFNCGRAVGAIDFCFGCKLHVCQSCGTNLSTDYGHTPSEHLGFEESDDDK